MGPTVSLPLVVDVIGAADFGGGGTAEVEALFAGAAVTGGSTAMPLSAAAAGGLPTLAGSPILSGA